MQKIRITKDQHFFELEDHTPFFYLGDTAWEIFHRLTLDEAREYFVTRASQGYNVIQAVALAEFEGLTVPNRLGRLPLLCNQSGEYDPTMPDLAGKDSYWDHMDAIIDLAAQCGLYIALLPTWGDKFNLMWGKGPEIFTPENALVYGAWIGDRYKHHNNILWMMGGDRPLTTDTHLQIVRNMALGIRQSGADQLMTFHPSGGSSSSAYVQEETWLDCNSFQSGHGHGWHKSYQMVQHDWSLSPTRPVFNSEPRYEDHPAYFNISTNYLWNAADVRVHIWWDCLSGAAGHTYGNHSIWSMTTTTEPYFPYTWKEVLWHDGAQQMRFAKDTLLAYAPTRQPMQEILLDPGDDATAHIAACRSGKNVLCYSPLGLPIRVKLGLLDETVIRASWICPRTGMATIIGLFPKEDCTFVPSTQGKGNDWVLLLEELPNIK